jgi:prolyl 4-hydroxylase
MIVNTNGNEKTDYRNSKQIWLNDNVSPIVKKISNVTEIMTNLPKKNMEELQMVKYDTSGYFKQHYDPYVDDPNSNIRDRIYTILIYLNDVEEGGETYFNNLNISIKPKKGTGVIFKSLLSDNTVLKKSLHQGMSVLKGNKIICKKWVHIKKFNKIINKQ